MINTTKKYYARRIIFFLLASLSSFLIASQRMFEFYHNYFYFLFNFIFLFLGVGSAYFTLFLKPLTSFFSYRLSLLFFFCINLLMFSIPFITTTGISWLIEYGIYFVSYLIGMLFVFLFAHFSHLINFEKKDNLWVILGLIVGSAVTAMLQIFCSAFESFFITVIFVFIAGLFIGFKSKRHFIPISILMGISLIVFIVFEVFGLTSIGYGNKSLNRMGGIFSNQVRLDKESQSQANTLGLSKLYSDMIPTFKNIYVDGDKYDQFIQALPTSSYFSFTPYKVSYSLGGKSRVLILNARGASSVYLAYGLTTAAIDAVEKNEAVLKTIRDDQSAYIGGVYHNRNTIFYRSSARSYVASSKKKYDIINVPFTIGYKNTQLLTSKAEPLFSKEAMESYFNILNKNGFVYFAIKSEFNILKEAIVLNIIKTISSLYDNNKILNHIKVFTSGDITNILLFKNEILDQSNIQYNNLITSLQFIDNLEDSNMELTNNILAVLNNNQNVLDNLDYSIKVRQDSDTYWLYKLGSLYSHNVPYFMDTISDVVLIAVVLLIVTVLLLKLSASGLKKTVHSKIQLPGFLAYFVGNGVGIGILIIAFLDFFYFVMQQELTPGSLFVTTLIISSAVGATIFKLFTKRYFRVIISLSVILLLTLIYFLLFPILSQQYFISMSLIMRIFSVVILLATIFTFLFIPFFSGGQWVSYFDQKSHDIVYSIFFLSLIGGLLIGLLLLLLISYQVLMVFSIICFIVSLVYFILMDKHYRRVNFLYRRSRY